MIYLSAAGLTLKAKKCALLATEIDFLVRVVSEKGCSIGSKIIEAIQNLEEPTTATAA